MDQYGFEQLPGEVSDFDDDGAIEVFAAESAETDGNAEIIVCASTTHLHRAQKPIEACSGTADCWCASSCY